MTINAESKFVELVRSWLVSLPHDLKIAFDAMDDENLPRTARELATGAVIHIVSPKDSALDQKDQVVSYADDAVLLGGLACQDRRLGRAGHGGDNVLQPPRPTRLGQRA